MASLHHTGIESNQKQAQSRQSAQGLLGEVSQVAGNYGGHTAALTSSVSAFVTAQAQTPYQGHVLGEPMK